METKDLILAKGKESDWKDMYENVWSRKECTEYTVWRLSADEEDAKARMLRTIEFGKTHDMFMIYEKKSQKAIGFIGFEQLSPTVYSEAGICIGPDYQRKGYGKQALRCILEHCQKQPGAEEFFYFVRERNMPSRKLAESFDFELLEECEEKTDPRTGEPYRLLKYRLRWCI